MKKWMGLLCAVVVGMPVLAGAEPIAFEQAANVTGLAGVEVGVDFDYSSTKLMAGDVALSESQVSDLPVFVRAGIPVLEARVTVPYGVANTIKDSITNEEANYSGIRDVGLMLKTGLLSLPVFSVAFGLDTTFPTGDPTKYLGKGLDLNPFLAAGINAGLVKINANVGFEYRGEFTVKPEIDASGVTLRPEYKVNPGDAFTYAVGVEVPAGDVFSLHAELLGAGYSEMKRTQDGTEVAVPNSIGSTMTLVPGIRAHAGPFKAKVGVEIPVTKNEDFKLTQNSDQADLRVIAGASLQFSL